MGFIFRRRGRATRRTSPGGMESTDVFGDTAIVFSERVPELDPAFPAPG